MYKHTPEQIATELRIDEDGNLWWRRKKPGRKTYKPVSGTTPQGYVQVVLDYEHYLGHILAWCLYYGEWPDPNKDIDHINEVKNDNRKCNLRLADRADNIYNSGVRADNTSGARGVSFHEGKQRWRARLKVDGHEYVNYHTTYLEAVEGRRELEARYNAGPLTR